ncbi:MAG: hypothetical protein ACJZ2F_05240 [Acidimicrobiales bacterium]
MQPSEAFLAAKEIGATTILNPAPATGIAALPEGLLELTDWLIPNENEFLALSNEVVSESSIFFLCIWQEIFSHCDAG